VILTSLMVTVVVLGLVQTVVSVALIRRFKALRQTEARVERFNDALALLTEATESGFRSTAAELQRVAAVQRHSEGPFELQRRLERAAELGGSVPQIAGQEGISEGEVQLRLHMARANQSASEVKENHVGTV